MNLELAALGCVVGLLTSTMLGRPDEAALGWGQGWMQRKFRDGRKQVEEGREETPREIEEPTADQCSDTLSIEDKPSFYSPPPPRICLSVYTVSNSLCLSRFHLPQNTTKRADVFTGHYYTGAGLFLSAQVFAVIRVHLFLFLFLP